jgi:hypothetical protein
MGSPQSAEGGVCVYSTLASAGTGQRTNGKDGNTVREEAGVVVGEHDGELGGVGASALGPGESVDRVVNPCKRNSHVSTTEA